MDILLFDEFDILNFGGKEKAMIDLARMLSKDYNVVLASTSAVKIKRISEGELHKLKKGVKYERVWSLNFFGHAFFLNPVAVFKLVKKSDVVYIATPDIFTTPLFLLFAKTLGKKVIAGFHDPDFFEQKSLIKKIKRAFDKPLLYFFDGFHALTPFQFENLKRYKKREFLIPNIINSHPGLRISYPEEFNAVFFGRLSYQKGVDLLIEALSEPIFRRTKINFIIAGDGEYKQRVADFALKNKKVSYVGFVSEAEKNAMLENAALLLFPSRFETQPIALMEALVCGVPFVGFDLDEVRIFSNEKNSYLAKPFDAKDFSKGVMSFYNLWKDKKGEYLNLRKAIRREMLQKYSPSKVYKDYKKMFEFVKSMT